MLVPFRPDRGEGSSPEATQDLALSGSSSVLESSSVENPPVTRRV